MNTAVPLKNRNELLRRNNDTVTLPAHQCLGTTQAPVLKLYLRLVIYNKFFIFESTGEYDTELFSADLPLSHLRTESHVQRLIRLTGLHHCSIRAVHDVYDLVIRPDFINSHAYLKTNGECIAPVVKFQHEIIQTLLYIINMLIPGEKKEIISAKTGDDFLIPFKHTLHSH